ncbi:MAG: hypothetical protein M0Z76_09185 [Gammaproteobacteria bacterium]|nr:hypothetical protein [Gammaproteobacteria bacterium]
MKTPIHEYFARTPDLAALCTQNGWPDNDSLRIDILEETPDRVHCAVSFDEILVEGAGCVAGRVRCWARFRVERDARGRVIAAIREM